MKGHNISFLIIVAAFTLVMTMIIFGQVAALVSFPGVIIHEFSRKIFCNLFKIKVHAAKYFDPFNKVHGYIIHDQTNSLLLQFFISFAPFFINILLCILLIHPFELYKKTEMSIQFHILIYITYWLGISCGMHIFPNDVALASLYKSCSIYRPVSYLSYTILFLMKSTILIFSGINSFRCPLFDYMLAHFIHFGLSKFIF